MQADKHCSFQFMASKAVMVISTQTFRRGMIMQEHEWGVLMVWDEWVTQHLSCSIIQNSITRSHLNECQGGWEMTGSTCVLTWRGGPDGDEQLALCTRVYSEGYQISLCTFFLCELSSLPSGAHPKFHVVTEFISNHGNSGLCSFLSTRLGCDFVLYYTLTWVRGASLLGRC